MSCQFTVFGSEDSLDYDIIVYVEKLGNIAQCRAEISIFEKEVFGLILEAGWPTKKINLNLGMASNGIFVDVFKGTPDEVTNSVYNTAKLHQQLFESQITRTLPRDFGIKALRSTRAIISFLSHSDLRPKIKKALAGDVQDKISLLKDIRFSSITDLGNKNSNLIDYYKTCAFQMGQVCALADGVELYSKAEIADKYPELRPFLYREGGDPLALDLFKGKYLNVLVDKHLPRYEILRD